ncbi:MAG: hypothetical protein ACRDPW_10925 [Mycobacteriales bacterium]
MGSTYTTMRVPVETRDVLVALAKKEGKTIGGEILDLAKRREHELRWAEIRQAYDRLRQDGSAWNDYQAEADLLDQAAADGLDGESPYPVADMKPSAQGVRHAA